MRHFIYLTILMRASDRLYPIGVAAVCAEERFMSVYRIEAFIPKDEPQHQTLDTVLLDRMLRVRQVEIDSRAKAMTESAFEGYAPYDPHALTHFMTSHLYELSAAVSETIPDGFTADRLMQIVAEATYVAAYSAARNLTKDTAGQRP